MSDLKWLDGYSGQSTAELIALEKNYRVDSLVLGFEQAIDQKAARSGEHSLTAEELVVLAVEALEREVNNGGYSQFFVNSSSEYVPTIVASLERIGCQEAARLTERAIDAVGIDLAKPGHNLPGVIEKLAPDRIEQLEQCDAAYFDVVGDLAGPLFEFIKRERARIVLS